MAERKYIRFRRFFLVMLAIQVVVAVSRDFVLSRRYTSIQVWASDLVPASFGLILAATINAAVVYGVYRAYKAVTKKR